MKKSFVLYTDNYEPIKGLTQEQKGDLLDAIFQYNIDGTEDINDIFVATIFGFFKIHFKRDKEKWDNIAERNKKNGMLGGRPKKTDAIPSQPQKPSGLSGNPEEPKKAVIGIGIGIVNDIGIDKKVKDNILSDSSESNETPKIKTSRFIKPTIEEIKAYCLERKNSIDPVKFFDFYETSNWMRGKNKIKDWKACVRTWERNDTNKKNGGAKKNGFNEPGYYGESTPENDYF